MYCIVLYCIILYGAGLKKQEFGQYPAEVGWEWQQAPNATPNTNTDANADAGVSGVSGGSSSVSEACAWQVDHSKAFGDTDDEGELKEGGREGGGVISVLA